MSDDNSFVLLVAFGIAAVAGGIFLQLNRDAALKRRVFPWYMIAMGVLWLVYAMTAGFPPWTFLLLAPWAALVVYATNRFIKFCDACGATQRMSKILRPPRVCSICGAPLDRGD